MGYKEPFQQLWCLKWDIMPCYHAFILSVDILLFLRVLPPCRVPSGAHLSSVEVACLAFHGGGT